MSYLNEQEAKCRLLHIQARMLACAYVLRDEPVPTKLKSVVAATQSLEALEKHNPDWGSQPRVPAGNPTGGQWTSGGYGPPSPNPSPNIKPPKKPERPSIDDIYDPPLEPVYPVEFLIGGLGALSAKGAIAAIRIVTGTARALYSSIKIQRAAKAIEEYFGGRPNVKVNPAKDIVLMKGDKKIRLDVNNPAPHKEPHFHIERAIPKGKRLNWKPAGPEKRYPFKGD